jgi:dCMP deaminase
MTHKWDIRFLDLAEHISEWSKDPSTKVGAVAVSNDRQILSIGYNGLPRNIDDSVERLYDREVKYSLVVHAEMNCIYNATHNGVSLNGALLYVHGLPICQDCAKGVIQVGINRIVLRNQFANNIASDDRHDWHESFSKTSNMFRETGIQILIL